MQELLELPQWALFLIGAIIVFVIGQLHHLGVELADGYLNRPLDEAESTLGKGVLQAADTSAIDGLLSDGALRALKLSSAATFRRTEAGFHRDGNSPGWSQTATRDLALDDADLAALAKGSTVSLGDAATTKAGFPPGLEMPLLAVPAASRARCYAVTLYGPHESGTDIDANECHMLESLGRLAADAYARLENEQLRGRIAALESQLRSTGARA